MAGLTKIKSGGITPGCDLDGSGTLKLDSTNNRVGIGEASPDTKLHVNSGTTNDVAKFESTDVTATINLVDNAATSSISQSGEEFIIDADSGNGDANSRLIFKVDNSEKVRIDKDGVVQIQMGGTAHTEFGQNTTKDNFISQGTSGKTVFRKNDNTELMRIDSSGNVGIGTTSPYDTLHIGGTGTTGIRLGTQGTTGRARMYIDSANDYGLRFDTQNVAAAFMIDRDTGDLGIRNAAPQVALHFSDAAANSGIRLGDGADIEIKRSGTSAYFNVGADCNNYAFNVGGSDVVRITSAGDVGIGTTSVARGPLHINSSTADTYFHVTNSTTGSSASDGFTLHQSGTDTLLNNREAGNLRLYTSGNEKMRIAADGRILQGEVATLNNESAYATGSSVYHIQSANSNSTTLSSQKSSFYVKGYGHSTNSEGANNHILVRDHGGGATNPANFMRFYQNTGEVFRVESDGDVKNQNNSYGSLSDQRLKENIVDAGSQWDDLKALRIRKFNFKDDNTDPEVFTGISTHTQMGVIAQEVELVSPGLVSCAKLEDGSDDPESMKTVKYSVLYMKAVKALQEAMGRIETLEAEVAALKSN